MGHEEQGCHRPSLRRPRSDSRAGFALRTGSSHPVPVRQRGLPARSRRSARRHDRDATGRHPQFDARLLVAPRPRSGCTYSVLRQPARQARRRDARGIPVRSLLKNANDGIGAVRAMNEFGRASFMLFAVMLLCAKLPLPAPCASVRCPSRRAAKIARERHCEQQGLRLHGGHRRKAGGGGLGTRNPSRSPISPSDSGTASSSGKAERLPRRSRSRSRNTAANCCASGSARSTSRGRRGHSIDPRANATAARSLRLTTHQQPTKLRHA